MPSEYSARSRIREMWNRGICSIVAPATNQIGIKLFGRQTFLSHLDNLN